MIKVYSREYVEDSKGVREFKITFIGITIFKRKDLTTNNEVVRQLTVVKPSNKIIGFKHETKSKSKKN